MDRNEGKATNTYLLSPLIREAPAISHVYIFRSVVHRLGTREHHPPDSSIDGNWAHDKFLEHDQLVSYPVPQQQQQQQYTQGRRDRNKEHTEIMDTSG